jgi:hypothetical protein
MNNFWAVMNDHLLKNLHKLKAVGIDLIRQLVEVYLVKSTDVSVAGEEKMQHLIQQLFPKKLATTYLAEKDCMDALIDFACMVSTNRIDFAMKNIMTELLRPDIISPE